MRRLRCVRQKRISPMAGSRRSPKKCSAEHFGAGALLVAVITGGFADRATAQETLPPYAIVGDTIPAPLAGAPGDAARGRAIVGNRQVGLCLLCHTGPFPEEK